MATGETVRPADRHLPGKFGRAGPGGWSAHASPQKVRRTSVRAQRAPTRTNGEIAGHGTTGYPALNGTVCGDIPRLTGRLVRPTCDDVINMPSDLRKRLWVLTVAQGWWSSVRTSRSSRSAFSIALLTLGRRGRKGDT